MAAPQPQDPHVAPGVDRVRLVRHAEEIFRGELEILQLVAASDERALLVCRHVALKRKAALRVHVAPERPGRRWFVRETELLAALDHPVIRPVYWAGDRQDWAFRITRWVEGESLTDAVRRGPRLIPDTLQLARDLTSALDYAHSQRIVVRRMVPETVMLELSGRTFITDLRYANVLLDVATRQLEHPDGVPFLAPEIRDGAQGDPSSDVYAAAAVLFFAVTGRAPATDPATIVSPRSLRPACPKALERVIMRGLRAEPSSRYLTAGEMAADLLSDLGEYDPRLTVTADSSADVSEDPRAWEKRLRRALGDDYELLHELGVGGFGRVYRVRDLALERDVALKILHPYLTADPAVVERFRREARFAAQLEHPNIVNIYDIGGRAGLIWYTMEYVRGRSLGKIVEAEGLQPVDRVARILVEALDALALAHDRGLVHRDLKPENLLIEEGSGRVRIADFGLAIAFKGIDRHGGASSRSGTPEFAAPEQLLGEPVDHRADLYSLTLTAFFALTGRAPFTGRTIEAIVAQHAAGRLPRIAEVRRDVPDRLVRVLKGGAARRPEERFESARAYADAIRRARRPWRALLDVVRRLIAADV